MLCYNMAMQDNRDNDTKNIKKYASDVNFSCRPFTETKRSPARTPACSTSHIPKSKTDRTAKQRFTIDVSQSKSPDHKVHQEQPSAPQHQTCECLTQHVACRFPSFSGLVLSLCDLCSQTFTKTFTNLLILPTRGRLVIGSLFDRPGRSWKSASKRSPRGDSNKVQSVQWLKTWPEPDHLK